jgi:hypothetical protein
MRPQLCVERPPGRKACLPGQQLHTHPSAKSAMPFIFLQDSSPRARIHRKRSCTRCSSQACLATAPKTQRLGSVILAWPCRTKQLHRHLMVVVQAGFWRITIGIIILTRPKYLKQRCVSPWTARRLASHCYDTASFYCACRWHASST